MTVTWGILGAANIAKKIIPAIQASKEGKIEAIASRSSEKAKKFSDEFTIPNYYDDYTKLLENDQIEAIYVPLPNDLHRLWTIEAAKYGKHVLCEKPFALTPKEAEEMFQAGVTNNVKIMEAFMYRFDPKIEKVKSLLEEGIIGEIRYLDFNFSHMLEQIFIERNDYRMKKEAGGGALYDLGVYGINMINYLLNEETEKIEYCSVVSNTPEDIDRTVYLQLKYKENKVATITGSFQYYGNNLSLHGTEGTIEVTNIISQGEGEIRIRQNNGNNIERQVTQAFNSYNAMIDHFNDCIQQEKEQFVTKEQTMQTLRTVEKALEKMTLI